MCLVSSELDGWQRIALILYCDKCNAVEIAQFQRNARWL